MIRILSQEEIIEIYNKRMVHDFPASELKPLAVILDAIKANKYVCYGMSEAGRIVGYMYVIRNGEDYLIDYFAIDKQFRNKGFGGKMIALLRSELKTANSIIAEVEIPDFAESESEREIRKRRYDFYMRNCFCDTLVKVNCFGVKFIVIEMELLKKHDTKEVEKLYLMHYEQILPREMFVKNISII